jgi:hypothetical protein
MCPILNVSKIFQIKPHDRENGSEKMEGVSRSVELG